MKVLITLILSLSSLLAFAQPPNDACSGALSVTPDGTCYGPGLPETTTIDATDGWIGTVGCAGNNDEVWFTFTATASQLNFNVTSGTMGGDVEFILVEATSPCSGLGLMGSVCGASPLVDSITGLQIGATYYYTISSTGAAGTFTTCVDNVVSTPVAGQDCPTSAVLCDNTSFTQGTFTGVGLVEEISLNSCFGSDERQSKWYTFTIGCDGTLGFDIIPTVLTNDYDFALWNTTSGCYSTGVTMPAPVACNWSGTTGATGAAYEYIVDPGPNPCTIAGATDCANGGGPNAGCQACTYTSTILSVTAGETYSLLIDNFGASGSGFTFNFGGTAVIGPSADFTMVSPSCGAFDFTKTCQTTNSTFLWNFGDGSTSTVQNPSYTYTISGTYTVSLEVTDALGCTKTSSQTVTVGIPPAPAVSGAGTYCFGDPINLGATASSGGTLNWYDDAGLTNLVNTGTTYTPVLAVGGPYTYYVTETASGCTSAASSIVVNVTTADDASFSYATTTYCQNGSDPTPTITGLAGGTFSSTAGLSINSATGTIDVSASTAGAYTVTYLTGGVCPSSETFNLTISATEDPSFTYGSATYCQDATDPSPTITGTAGGTFSSTAGLSISSGTGLIDVSASTVGNYVITYTTPGTCFASTTFNVEIIAVDDPTFSYAAASYCQNGVDPTPTITTSGGTFSSGAGLSIAAGTGVIDLSASTAGVYTVTYLTSGTCPASTTFGITIVAVDDPSFSYSASAYCQDDSDPTPTITGTAGGTFSAGAGLSISAGTGLIDVSASTIGSYTVTYLTGGTCPASTTFNVDIDAVDDPTFSYAAATYCQNGVDPTPTVTTAGGTFSAGAGLSIVAGTGVIDLSASTAGVYTVTYLTGGTCPASTTFGITIVAADDPSFSYASASYCQNGVDPTPTITGTAGGTFSAGVGLSIAVGTGVIDLSASTAGVYTVTYLTGGACPASTTFGITIVAADDASFSYSSGTFCLTSTDPTPTITGTAGGTFTQTGGLTINATSGLIDLGTSGVGSYTVTYTTAGACPTFSNFAISITSSPDATFSYTGTPYCEGAGVATVTYGPGASGGDFTSTAGLVINIGTGEVNLNTSTPGIYTVNNDIAAGGGCAAASASTSIEIVASDDATFSYASSNFCQDETNPTPTAITGGGTYSSTAGLSITAGTGEINLAASTTGTYTITYTTAGVCPSSSTFDVTITAVDDASFSYSTNEFCVDGLDPSPILSGTPGGTYSSTGGISINSVSGVIDVSASTAGTYTITYTTSGTCSAFSTFDVTITNVDDPTFSYSSASFCQDDVDPSPTVTTGGGSFSSTAGLVINVGTGIIDLAGSTPGAYDITYLTSGTCPSSTTFSLTITGVQDPSFSYTSASYCQDESDPLPTVTTGGGTFSSTAGLIINAGTGVIDLSASTAGVYTVTYLTGGTCPASSTFDVTINAVEDPTFSYSSATYCQDESDPSPTVTTSGGTFSSTAGLNIAGGTGIIDLAGSTPGAYDITYLTSGACPASTTFSVTITAVDDASFSYSANTYCQDDVNPTPTISTGGGTFTATAGLTINSVTGVVNLGTSTIGGPYTVTYTTAGTCSASSTFDITIEAVDDATFSYASSTYCQDESNPVPTVTTVGGTFSSGAGLVIDSSTGEIDLVSSTAGPYTVTYLTGGTCPASSTFIVVIDAVDDASFTYSSNAFCIADPNPIATINGTLGGAFTMNPSGTINSNNGEIDVVATGAGTYMIYYTTSGTCPAVDSTEIIITNQLDATITLSGPYCTGDVVDTLIAANSGGTWSGTGVNAVTGEFDPSAAGAGTFEIIYVLGGSCGSRDTVDLVVVQSQQAVMSEIGPFCSGDLSEFIIVDTVGGTWSGTGVDNTTGEFDPQVSGVGTFDIIYSPVGTCMDNDTIQVIVNQTPTANAGVDVTIDAGASTSLNASGGGTYVWTPANDLSCTTCANPIANPMQTTTYLVTVTNSGCSDTSSVTVTVNELENNEFFVPNIFSPNGDGNNDVFLVEGSGLDNFNLKIFSRWGELVFESDNQSTGWDGTHKNSGEMLNAAVFVYQIEYVDSSGEGQKINGNVTLVK